LHFLVESDQPLLVHPACHPALFSTEVLNAGRIRVEKLPPNTTAKYQPLDQGIIHCVKRFVLSQKMMMALDRLGESIENPYTVDMLTALLWCETA
jgi:hypothetical protein